MKTLATLLFLIAVSFAAVAQEKDLVPFGKNIDPNPVNTLKQRLDSVVVLAYPMLESNGLENWEKKS